MVADLEMDESPVGKLVNAILLSSLKKHATEIAIRKVEGHPVVDFLIDGAGAREMQPPSAVYAHVVRRVRVMASIPFYPLGHHGVGTLVLMIGGDRRVEFAVKAEGHGEDIAVYLRRVHDS